ncbi:hypothetical protein BLS_003338 [Venturia inaequalis]|nr:hypothetical protein BLS_003338 [Venturia inaequalis]
MATPMQTLKRKNNFDDANNKATKKPAPNVKAPTLLSLPLELRQKIFYLTNDFKIEIVDKCHRVSSMWEQCWDNKRLCEKKKVRSQRQAEILREVHPSISKDLVFVCGQWEKEVDDLLEQSKGGAWVLSVVG